MDEKNKKRVAKYLRVSTRDQALYGFGLESQNSKINDYIKFYNYDKKNVYEYKDEGISAKNKKRPSLLKMMKDIEAGLIDEVIVYKLDRLTRSVIDMYEFIEFLNHHNCNLIAIEDNIDIHTANGRMMVGMLAIIAQWEREIIVERTKDGLLEMCESGKYPIGIKPFGWDKNNNILSVNKKESDYIKYLSSLVLQGYKLKEIEIKSFESEFPYNFSSMKIKKILLRTENYGLLIYKGKEYYNIVPPILNKEECLEVMSIISKRFKLKKSDKYYFNNLVKCLCGEILVQKSTHKKNKKYYYYYCENCKKRMNQSIILKSVLYRVFDYCNKKEIVKIQNIVKERIKRLDEKIELNYNQYISNVIDEKIYTQNLVRLHASREQNLAKVKVLYPDANNLWNSWNDSDRCYFIKVHVARVVVDIDLKIVVKIDFKK